MRQVEMDPIRGQNALLFRFAYSMQKVGGGDEGYKKGEGEEKKGRDGGNSKWFSQVLALRVNKDR
jgi:hypothetical protein